MKILNRYLDKTVFQYTTMTVLVISVLFSFFNFLDQINDLGTGNFNLMEAIFFIILCIPETIYEIVPIATLIGTIVGLSILAHGSELIVMRASGISTLQITFSALKIGGLFIAIAICIGEFISPVTTTKAQRWKSEALQNNKQCNQNNTGIWIKENDTYINIGKILPNFIIFQIQIFEFDPKKQLRSMISAKNGKFTGEFWILKHVNQTFFFTDGNKNTIKTDVASWKSEITPQILSIFMNDPDQLPFFQLSRYIDYLKKNQQKTDFYEMLIYNKLMLPLSTIVMILLGIPVVFSNIRSSTFGRNIFFGIMIGLGFYLINKIFGYIALTFGLSPLLGTTLPIASFFLLKVITLQRIE